ncbi:hypothetical protein AGLY_001651 [Aphis glycines]|uniref:Uncharacterized protein n=1 Tax=Aphis glycines TaxID=307491 RepID=A0A6G0U6Q2_APHGL|nr:hypothetical protein AGLY_001651 [Aphis glycines]
MLQFQSSWVISDGEVKFLVHYTGQNFQKNREKQKKVMENGNSYSKSCFDQIDFFVWLYSKTYHCKYLKFSPNVYISVIYIHNTRLYLVKIFMIGICQNHENLQVKKFNTKFSISFLQVAIEETLSIFIGKILSSRVKILENLIQMENILEIYDRDNQVTSFDGKKHSRTQNKYLRLLRYQFKYPLLNIKKTYMLESITQVLFLKWKTLGGVIQN